MSVYDSEEEQVEALKKWWNENGKSIVGGIVLGLVAVFGWNAWKDHQEQSAASASMRYEKMGQAIAAGNSESALLQGEKIVKELSESTYALLAALDLAKLKLDKGDSDSAKSHYEWVIEKSTSTSLKQLAMLRLARVLISTNDLDGAEKIISQADKDNFAGEFAVVRGDIAYARNDYAAARTAYADALSGEIGNRRLVRMKLDNLGATKDEK